MANTLAPNGFVPRRLVSGAPYNGATNTYRIASGYATALYPGDAVKLLTTGYINKASAGDRLAGIFVGVYFQNSANVPTQFRYWPASTVTFNSQDAVALVIDDPNVLFEAQFGNSSSVPATADIGANFNLYDAGGNASFAKSGEGVDYTTLTTSAAQFRLVDYVKRPDNDTASANSRGLFIIDDHMFKTTTGI